MLVDNFADLGITQAELTGKHPFLVTYRIEDILSWTPEVPIDGFDRILLKEQRYKYNDFDLPTDLETFYRYMERLPNGEGVIVRIYEGVGKNDLIEEHRLDLPRIPFTLFQIEKSLMTNIDKYQIALLNTESSDLSYISRMNFPFYYEFHDDHDMADHFKPHSDGTTHRIIRRK